MKIDPKNFDIRDLYAKLAERQLMASLAGFGVCAGYLSAILEQARLGDSATDGQLDAAYQRGKNAVVDLYLGRNDEEDYWNGILQ